MYLPVLNVYSREKKKGRGGDEKRECNVLFHSQSSTLELMGETGVIGTELSCTLQTLGNLGTMLNPCIIVVSASLL